jgi:hypothetical protein
MKSNFLTINWKDFFQGLLLSVLTSVVTGFYELLKTGAALDWTTIKPVILAGVTMGIGWILKNFLTNSDGKILTSEKNTLKSQTAGRDIQNGNAGAMRILIFIIVLSGIGLSVSAQGFWRPTTNDVFKKNSSLMLKANLTETIATDTTSAWALKPLGGFAAQEWVWNKDTKSFDPYPISSYCVGVGYKHFTRVANKPFNDWGVNMLALLGSKITDDGALSPSFGLALTGSFNIFQAGVAYDFKSRTPGIVLNIIFNP